MSTIEIFVSAYVVSLGVMALYYSRKINKQIRKEIDNNIRGKV